MQDSTGAAGAGQTLAPIDPNDPVAAAKDYHSRGWLPLPVPRGQKGPKIRDWPHYVCDPQSIETVFHASNVGVLLGARSGGLVDVDLDCREAEVLAALILPPTDAIFGRASKPRSHYLYVATPTPKSKKFAEQDGTTLLEIRSTGMQTMFPGSVHPLGEHVVWANEGNPAAVDDVTICEAAALLAAASVIARNWPASGSRNDAALALSGGLYSAGVDPSKIPAIIAALARAAGDEEADARGIAADSTVTKASRGEPVTGWPRLAELLGKTVVDVCAKLLGNVARNWSSSGGGGNERGDGGRRRAPGGPPQSKLIVDIAESHILEVFRDNEDAYATVTVGEGEARHVENLLVEGTRFRRLMTKLFHERQRVPPNGAALTEAIAVFNARALFDGKEVRTHYRVASGPNKVYVDLGDDTWRSVEISASGWLIVDHPPAKLVRKNGMKPLPTPERGGNINLLRPFLNVDDADWILTVAWLIGACRPEGPFTILVVIGEHGAAKSTMFRILRSLLDPSAVPDRSLPSNNRDLAIAVHNTRLLVLDNLTTLSSAQSDDLCRVATGAGFGVRKHYSNTEEQLFFGSCPIALNGIPDFATRPDLADRSVCITPKEIKPEDRRDEKALWADSELKQPLILGALYDAIASALGNLPTVNLAGLPRMADFAKWVAAAEHGLGWAAGNFMRAYENNAQHASVGSLEASPLAIVLIKYFEGKGTWTGRASDLLVELDQSSAASRLQPRRPWWPETPMYLV